MSRARPANRRRLWARAPLVTFSGLDGCGKSTQLDLLASALSPQPVARIWSRGGYTEGVLLAKRLFRRLAGRRAPPPGPGAQREHALGRPWVRELWLNAAILDLIRLYGVELRVRGALGQAVLCDRYLWDSLVDFQVNFPGVDVRRRLLWRALERVARPPDAAFFLEIEPALSEQRAVEKNDPFPEPLEARTRRRAAYAALRDRFLVLDARRTREDLHAQIRARVDAAAAPLSAPPPTPPQPARRSDG